MLQKMNDDRTLLRILGPFLVAIVTFSLRLILPKSFLIEFGKFQIERIIYDMS